MHEIIPFPRQQDHPQLTFESMAQHAKEEVAKITGIDNLTDPRRNRNFEAAMSDVFRRQTLLTQQVLAALYVPAMPSEPDQNK